MYYVYILFSKTANKYYIGHTDYVQRRLSEHNDPLANMGKFCSKNGPWEIVYTESDFATRADAMKREKQIKSWKSRKKIEELVNAYSANVISSVVVNLCTPRQKNATRNYKYRKAPKRWA
jgi:putative endonuclease